MSEYTNEDQLRINAALGLKSENEMDLEMFRIGQIGEHAKRMEAIEEELQREQTKLAEQIKHVYNADGRRVSHVANKGFKLGSYRFKRK